MSQQYIQEASQQLQQIQQLQYQTLQTLQNKQVPSEQQQQFIKQAEQQLQQIQQFLLQNQQITPEPIIQLLQQTLEKQKLIIQLNQIQQLQYQTLQTLQNKQAISQQQQQQFIKQAPQQLHQIQLLLQNQQITPEQQQITQLLQQQLEQQQQITQLLPITPEQQKLINQLNRIQKQITQNLFNPSSIGPFQNHQKQLTKHKENYQEKNDASIQTNFDDIKSGDRKGSYRENFSEFIDTILSFNTSFLVNEQGSTIKEYIYLKLKSYVNKQIAINLSFDGNNVIYPHVAGGIYGGTSWNYHSSKFSVDGINKKAVLPGNYDIFFSLNLMNKQHHRIPGTQDSLQKILTYFEFNFVNPTADYLRSTIWEYLETAKIKNPSEYFRIYVEKAEKEVVIYNFNIGDQVQFKITTINAMTLVTGKIIDFVRNVEIPKYKVQIQDGRFFDLLEEQLKVIPQGQTVKMVNTIEYHMPYKGTWSGGYGNSSTKSYGFKILFGKRSGKRDVGRSPDAMAREAFSEAIFSNLEEGEDDSSIINKKLLFYLEIQINTINNERLLTLFEIDDGKNYLGLNIPGLNLVSSFLLEKKMRSKNKGFDLDIVRDNIIHKYYLEKLGGKKQIQTLEMLFGGEWDNIFSNNFYSQNNPGVKEDWDNLRCNILRKILEDEKTEAVITGASAGNRIKDQQILSKLMNEFSGGGHPKYSQFFKVLTDKILNDMPGGGNGNTGLPSFRQLIDFVISGTNYLGQHVTNFQGHQVNGIFRLEGSGGDAIRHYLPDAITSTADFDTKLFINETITVENQIDGAPPITGGKDRTKIQAFSRPSLDVAGRLNIPFNKGFYDNYHQQGRINMRYYLEVKMTILVAIISKILDDYKFFRFNFEYTVNVPSFGNFQCVLDSTQQENITRIRKLNDYTVDTPGFKSLLSLDARLKIRWYLLGKYIGYSFYEFPPLDMAFYDGSKKLKHVLGKNDSIRSIGVTGSTSLFTLNDKKTGLLTPLPSLGEIYQDLQKNMKGERAIERAAVGKTQKDRDRINAFEVKYQVGDATRLKVGDATRLTMWEKKAAAFYLPGNATQVLDQHPLNALDQSKHQDFLNIQHIFYKLIPAIFDPNVTTEKLTEDYYNLSLYISGGDFLTIVNAQLLLLLARSKGRQKLPYGNTARDNFWRTVSQNPDVKESIRKYKLSYGGRKKKNIKKIKKKIKKSKKNKRKVRKKLNFRKSRGQVRKKLNFRKSRRKISKNKPKKKKNTQNSKK